MNDESQKPSVNINYDELSAELKVRKEVLERLILSFSNTLADRMKQLEEAYGQKDSARMRQLLHEIKGTAGNLRLKTITDAESVMHEAVKAGEDMEKIGQYFKTLKMRSDELLEYLNK